MNSIGLLTKWKKILFVAVGLVLLGCGLFNPFAETKRTSGHRVFVHKGTTSQYYSENRPALGFVSYNYIYREFVDVNGDKRNELTSGLGVSIVDEPETYHYYAAYVGLTIHYYSYKLVIIRIGVDSQSLYTEILVTEIIPVKTSLQSCISSPDAINPV